MKKIFSIIILAIFASACSNVGTNSDSIQNNIQTHTRWQTVEVKAEYDVYNSCTHIRTIVLDGHEYYMFTSNIANPPYVIHSEACPCHYR